MNGDLCKLPSMNGDGSRIPVASPRVGVRRSSSMRLRGERPCALRLHGGSNTATIDYNKNPPPDLLLAEGAALQARPRDLQITTTTKKNQRPRTRSLVSKKK